MAAPSFLARCQAAWRAFCNPDLLIPRVVTVVEEREYDVRLLPPRTASQRHRVYRWNPVRAEHETLYPRWAGDDNGARARDAFLAFVPQYEGEYAVYMDGDAERGRR